MSLTTYHSVRSTGYKRRGYCVASGHGSEGAGLSLADAGTLWRDFFPDDLGGVPQYVVKLDFANEVVNVVDEIATFNEAGFLTVLQMRDDEPQTRGVAEGIAESNAALNYLRQQGAEPGAFIYGNEPEFNQDADWLLDDPKKYTDIVMQVVAGVNFDGAKMFGSMGSWANSVEYLGQHRQSWEGVGLPPLHSFATHQHQGDPALSFRFDNHRTLRRAFPGQQIVNHETGWLPGQPPGGATLDSVNAAAYDVLNNLVHAHYGILCCDYTIINSAGTPPSEIANGLFRSNGVANVSGTVLSGLVAPFLDSKMRMADANHYVGPRVFASQAGQLILTSAPEAVDENVRKAVNQRYAGQSVSFGWQDVYDWLQGDGPRPADLGGADAAIFEEIYDDSTAHLVAGRSVAHINLPFAPSSAKVLGSEYNEGTDVSLAISGRVLSITHDRYAVVRLEVS